jgi:hypothetical protein
MANKQSKRKPLTEAIKSHNQVRVRIYGDELDIVNNYRRIFNEAHDMGINPVDVKHGWIKNKDASLFFKNPDYQGQESDKNKFVKDLVRSLEKHSPKYNTFKRKAIAESHLLVIDPADIHIGKLATHMETGDAYNSDIAVKRVREGVQGILNKASGFKIDKILFIGGNDILHIDTPRRQTTAGTPQDTCGMWYENFLKAKQLYVEIIEMLLPVADIHFTFNPSNHDYTNGFFLADVIKTHFRNCKNIVFDCSISHRKAYQYHSNLIGTTHGDGAKTADLPLLMATEFPKEWSNTKHRYVYTHHLHHKVAKDYIGLTVESLRSPSGTDSWHHRNGYQHSPKAIEGFIHSKGHGQIARLTHIF